MENQNKTENELFLEKLQEVFDATPKGMSLFFVAKEREVEVTRCINGCNATGGDLAKMIAGAVRETPSFRKYFEMGLALARLESDPLSALKDLFESNERKRGFGGFPPPLPTFLNRTSFSFSAFQK